MELSKDELLEELAAIAEAVESNPSVTVAYLATRLSKLQEKLDFLSTKVTLEVSDELKRVNKRLDGFGKKCRELERKIAEIHSVEAK